jgi:type I restriction enzyme S subunit
VREKHYPIPITWEWACIDDIGQTCSGGTPRTSELSYFDGDIPWITPADLTGYNDRYISKGRRNISEEGLRNSSARILPEGAILFSSRAPIGYVAIASNPLCTNQGFKSIAPSKGIDSRFIYYYLKSAKELAESMASGTTFRELSGSRFERLPIPIAPLNEQKRIVDKIEMLFSDLDKGEALLKQVQQQLGVYRQSVLKAAVTGELTREWREQNEHRLESGEALLLRIDKLRRESSKGKEVKFLTSNIEKPESLPNDWGWTTVEAICELNRKCAYGVLQPGDHVVDGEILVRVGDINGGKVNFEELKRISKKIYDQYQRTILQGNEVLITLVGAIGRSAVVPESLVGANVARAVGVIPVYTDEIYPQWLSYWFNSPKNSQLLVSLSHEVARKTLNLEDVRRFGVAIPPKEEQEEIVDRINDIFSQIDALEKLCATELARSEMLRQSILKAAFSGELVPQDPEDEPASEFLARIQAERASAARDGNARKSAGRRGRKATA